MFGRSRKKRKAAEAADERRREAEAKAAKEVADAAAHKKKELSSLALAYEKELKEIEDFYKPELEAANNRWELAEKDYQEIIKELSGFRCEVHLQIDTVGEEKRAELAANWEEDKGLLEKCYAEVKARALNVEQHYGCKIKEIDSLWAQVQGEMMHSKCAIAYDKLKSPTYDEAQNKAKDLSFLFAYFRLLHEQGAIDASEKERYLKFVHVLSRAENELGADKNFSIVDHEIRALFARTKVADSRKVFAAYKKDRVTVINTTQDSKQENLESLKRFDLINNDMTKGYTEALLNLDKWREGRHGELDSSCAELSNQSQAKHAALKLQHEEHVRTVEDEKGRHIKQVEVENTAQIAKVEEGHDANLKAIANALQEQHRRINQALEAELKNIKSSFTAKIVNAVTAVVGGAITYLSWGTLTAAGSWAAQALRNSIALTTIGSVARLVDGKDSFGVSLQAKLQAPNSAKRFQASDFNNKLESKRLRMDNSQTNLAAVKNSLRKINDRVLGLQQEAERDLFYSLDLDISVSKDNFSTALSFAAKPLANSQFGVQARLGALQFDGFRSVEWGVSINNQRNWYGSDFLRDSDIRAVLQRITGGSYHKLASDWHKPQLLAFESSGEKKEIVLDKAPAQKTKGRKIIDFWAHMSAMADEQQTDFYDRPAQGTYEAKLLGGAMVGATETVIGFTVGGLKFIAKSNAAAREMDEVFNPNYSIEQRAASQRQLITNGAEINKRIKAAANNVVYVVTNPAKTTFGMAYKFSEAVFSLVQSEDQFSAGRILGRKAVEARLIFSVVGVGVDLGVALMRRGVQTAGNAITFYRETQKIRNSLGANPFQGLSVSSPNVRVTGTNQAASASYNANNVNAQAALNKKVHALQKAQIQAERYASKQVPTSLGHPRAELKNYLKNINSVPREQLVKDLNSIGFKYTGGSGDGKYCKFAHPKRGFSVRIDDVHPPKRSNGCKYQHIHLFDKQGNSLNADLKIVSPSSADAHIKISELIKILELKP